MIAHLYLVMIWQALAPFKPTGESMKGKIGQRSSSVHKKGQPLSFGGGVEDDLSAPFALLQAGKGDVCLLRLCFMCCE